MKAEDLGNTIICTQCGTASERATTETPCPDCGHPFPCGVVKLPGVIRPSSEPVETVTCDKCGAEYRWHECPACACSCNSELPPPA